MSGDGPLVIELSIVIPSWNTRELLEACLRSLQAADLPEHEIVIVDNGSEDDTVAVLQADWPQVRLFLNETNEGFAPACNRGMRESSGRYILLLNTDTEVRPDAIQKLYRFLQESREYAAAAPKLIYPDGRVQKSCHRFPGLATAFFFSTPVEKWWPKSPEMKRYFMMDWDHEGDRDIDQPPAACMLVRADVLAEIGLFDEKLWLFYNDVDLSLRLAQAGWKSRYLGSAVVVHHEGASTAKLVNFTPVWLENRLTYYRKHFGRLGSVWLKTCVAFTWLDYVRQQLWKRVRGRPADPMAHLTRVFRDFLRQ